MERHLTSEEIQRMENQTLSASELLVAARHLAACSRCRDMAGERMREVSFAIEPVEPVQHLDPVAVASYRAGHADAVDREIIESHLEDCAVCRDEFRDDPVEGRRIQWLAAAAATVVAITVLMYSTAHQRAQHPGAAAVSRRQGYERSDWTDLVGAVTKSGKMPSRSDLGDLRPPPDALRGRNAPRASMLEPAGVVVESTRPRLRWTSSPRATYRVLLQQYGTSEVMRSPKLDAAEWIVSFDLRPGTTYEWQVRVSQNGASFIIPDRGAPRALFRVLESDREADLSAARRSHADDHLLLATLYARAGLDGDALAELERLKAAPAYAALANRLISDLQSRQ